MEQNTAPRSAIPSTAARPAAKMSLVDCLFSMPEGAAVKRITREQKAESARLESRLAAEMRALIAARLRGEAD